MKREGKRRGRQTDRVRERDTEGSRMRRVTNRSTEGEEEGVG